MFLPEIAPTWQEDKDSYFVRAAKAREANSHPELVGRNRTLCMEIVSNPPLFEKCKELALENAKTYSEIKKKTEVLRGCREQKDKKCVKELRALLKGLKDFRSSIKEQLAQLLGNEQSTDP